MEQLLKITTIPLEYQLKIQNARLEYSNSTASLDMDRTPGEFSIKSRPAKLNLDTYEARNSVVPTLKRSISQTAQKGLQAAQQATAQYAQEGQQLLNLEMEANCSGRFSDSGHKCLPENFSWDLSRLLL